jgi:hypothetical protein
MSRTHSSNNTVSYPRRLESLYNFDYKMVENYTECHPCFILGPSQIYILAEGPVILVIFLSSSQDIVFNQTMTMLSSTRCGMSLNQSTSYPGGLHAHHCSWETSASRSSRICLYDQKIRIHCFLLYVDPSGYVGLCIQCPLHLCGLIFDCA